MATSYLEEEVARPVEVYKRKCCTDQCIQYIIRLLETVDATKALQSISTTIPSVLAAINREGIMLS